jgi:membrane fusion protein, multidrug efflux system
MYRWILLLSVLAACSQRSEPSQELLAKGQSIVQDNLVPVHIRIAEITDLSQTMRFARGKLQSPHSVQLVFQASGYLEEILVMNGQQVNAGQVLARLESKQQRLTLTERSIALRQAQSLYENRMAEFGDSIRYGQNWTRIKEKLALNEGLEAARVAYERAKFELSLSELRAPVMGVVEGLEVRAGSFVTPGQFILNVHRNDFLDVVALVAEFNLPQLKTGDKADVIPLAYPDKMFQAELLEINPRVNENGLAQIRLRLFETKGLLPGMNVDVRLHPESSPMLSIPKDAIVRRPDGRTVAFTYSRGLAKWNYVELGVENGIQVAITKGLNPGDSVIVTGVYQLAHDSPVRLIY